MLYSTPGGHLSVLFQHIDWDLSLEINDFGSVLGSESTGSIVALMQENTSIQCLYVETDLLVSTESLLDIIQIGIYGPKNVLLELLIGDPTLK